MIIFFFLFLREFHKKNFNHVDRIFRFRYKKGVKIRQYYLSYYIKRFLQRTYTFFNPFSHRVETKKYEVLRRQFVNRKWFLGFVYYYFLLEHYKKYYSNKPKLKKRMKAKHYDWFLSGPQAFFHFDLGFFKPDSRFSFSTKSLFRHFAKNGKNTLFLDEKGP